MGHELEHTESAPGSVTPMYGPSAEHMPVHHGSFTHTPGWMELRTPRTPGNNILARLDRAWFYIAFPIRFTAITVLGLTHRWYYFVGVFVTFMFVYLLLKSNG